MNVSAKLDNIHLRARQNRWLYLFSIFVRIILAIGFIPPGIVKILGERFTSLAITHPMGNYLEALSYTGYYYTFIGIMQVVAGVLILIPRTVTLGALIYFPIILNICILSHAVRFDGSIFTSPLMVLACLFLLYWNYHQVKHILPFKSHQTEVAIPKWKELSWKFPYKFAVFTIITMALVISGSLFGYNLYPRNTKADCRKQCPDAKNPDACIEFCDCIFETDATFDDCLYNYNQSI